MDILKLPTDNLYIFFTLGGLLLLIFSISQLNKLFGELTLRIFKAQRKIKTLGLNLKHLETKIAFTDSIIKIHFQAFERNYNVKFVKPKDIDSIEDIVIPENLDQDKVINYIRDYNKIIKLLSKVQTELDNVELRSVKRITDSNELHFLWKNLLIRGIIFLLLICLSGGIIIKGFDDWYNKHQLYQDRLIKAQYEKTITKKN